MEPTQSLIAMEPTQPLVTIDQAATALAGAVVPLLVQLVRNHIIRELSPRATLALSLGIAAVATGIAYVQTVPSPNVHGYVAHLGVAFMVSQGIYRQFQAGITTTDLLKPANGAGNIRIPTDAEAAAERAEDAGELPAPPANGE